MSDRFYTPQPLDVGSFVLDGAEAHHLTVVRRFVPGDRVVLFNGDGRDYEALILAADRRQVLLDVHAGVEAGRELTVKLEVASALPKGDRGDFLVEKLTELGVTRFTPLVTDRTVVQPKDGRMDRLVRSVIEASKQCGRAVLMEVSPPAEWKSFLGRDDLPERKWILHPDSRHGNQPLCSPGNDGRILVAAGPEGGFADEEVAAAVAAGWRVANLGPRVLRVETATIAAVAYIAVNSLVGSASPTLP